jgi:hypothetical protein
MAEFLGLNDNNLPVQKSNFRLLGTALANRLVQPRLFSLEAALQQDESGEGKQSVFGLPVYNALDIQGGTYTDNNGEDVTYPSLRLDTVIMEASIPKNIVRTEIQGGDGTVKEYIGEGDVQINITGFIHNTGQRSNDNVFPVSEFNDFIRISRAKTSLKVNSEFLEFLEVTEIVIDSVKFGQVEGVKNVQSFQIQCFSDIPKEIQIIGTSSNTGIGTVE